MRLATFVACALLAGACVTPSHIETQTAEARPIQKLAVLGLGPEAPGPFLSARVLEALYAKGDFEVVSPVEVELALAGLPEGSRAPGEVGQAAASAFGADAVLRGQVHRFVERRGGEQGAVRPASVRFDLELYAVDGSLLWRGVYDETQRSVAQDVASFPLAMSRGFRWLSAEELASYGAKQLVRELGGAAAGWR